MRDVSRNMVALSTNEAQKWCLEHRVVLTPRGVPDLSSRGHIERFDIPSDAGQRVAMVRGHLELFKNHSILIWISEYDVWTSGQWRHLFDQFRKSYGITEELELKPAHLISATDFNSAISVAVYSVLMLWDCFFCTESTSDCLFYSHDEYGIKTKC